MHRGNRETVREGSYGRFLYNYFRTYDPATGRYLSPDPIGQVAGLNLYAYSASNPMSFFDPDGRQFYPTPTLYSPYSSYWPKLFPNSVPNIPTNPGLPPWSGYTCANKLKRKWAQSTANDKWIHCMIGGELWRTCGSEVAKQAAIGKEIKDALGKGDASLDDWLATLKGEACAGTIASKSGNQSPAALQKQLECCCRAKGYRP